MQSHIQPTQPDKPDTRDKRDKADDPHYPPDRATDRECREKALDAARRELAIDPERFQLDSVVNTDSLLRKVHFRTNPADIGADTIAYIVRWYTFGQTVHDIARKINSKRAVTDTIGLIDIYAILVIKFSEGIIAEHTKKQLARDEFTPSEFWQFYCIWQQWHSEKWFLANKPEFNQLAVRSCCRQLFARFGYNMQQSVDAERSLHEQEEKEQAAIDKYNSDTIASFEELERRHPILTQGTRAIIKGRIAHIVYGDKLLEYDQLSALTIEEREEFKALKLEEEELSVQPDAALTVEQRERKKEVRRRRKVLVGLLPPRTPKRPKEELEVIDNFAEGFDFGFSEDSEGSEQAGL